MLQGTRAALLNVAFALVLAGGPASAQTSDMHPDIEWGLLELGAVINPPETARFYAPLQEKEPYQGIKVAREYGPDARNALDIFAAEQPAATR